MLRSAYLRTFDWSFKALTPAEGWSAAKEEDFYVAVLPAKYGRIQMLGNRLLLVKRQKSYKAFSNG